MLPVLSLGGITARGRRSAPVPSVGQASRRRSAKAEEAATRISSMEGVRSVDERLRTLLQAPFLHQQINDTPSTAVELAKISVMHLEPHRDVKAHERQVETWLQPVYTEFRDWGITHNFRSDRAQGERGAASGGGHHHTTRHAPLHRGGPAVRNSTGHLRHAHTEPCTQAPRPHLPHQLK